ncbi:GNAT family N-acetyltransferase [Cohnella nanjingensis]|uniref:GNAT family N-acetyltransferase n=1 Tax=Cohnella nanjingensis TaxID=1387779 RepID=A0A7X0RS60_9BACL|nr:GNAT family N-acetyltransferase [Cohnella nanjingensis]MBB6671430.1 GNAT family N-acetyltransferase [Cohnella nanjingensis]
MAELHYRSAGAADVPLLAEMNQELIRDEGSRNKMSLAELAQRMAGWLGAKEWEARLLLCGEEAVGYALYQYREQGAEAYLRQYMIRREYRNRGYGLAGIRLLRERLGDVPTLSLDVLDANAAGRRFWARAGFVPDYIHMRLEQSRPADPDLGRAPNPPSDDSACFDPSVQ